MLVVGQIEGRGKGSKREKMGFCQCYAIPIWGGGTRDKVSRAAGTGGH